MTDIKTKHTPGPWSVNRKLKTYVDAGANGDGLLGIAVVDDAKEVPRQEAEANARLIAAAPDLLHAAKLAYELLFRHPGTPEHGTAMTAICAAISKATQP